MRVTDPTGQFDAVVITEGYGGAAGSIDWYIYIVLKGKPVPSDGLQPIFEASTLNGGEPVWKDMIDPRGSKGDRNPGSHSVAYASGSSANLSVNIVG